MAITKTIRVKDHKIVKYDVSADNYYPAEGQYEMNGQDHTVYVDLIPMGGDLTFTIQCVQENATILINGQEMSSISLPGGSSLSWECSCEGYDTQRGTIVNLSPSSPGVASPLIIDLSQTQLTFSIVAIPADSTITINGQTLSQITLPIGSRIDWTVACEGWNSQTGFVESLGADSPGVAAPLVVDLTRQEYSLTVTAQPNTASVTLLYNGVPDTKTGTNTITVPANSVVHVVAAQEGYTTYEQDITVDTPNKAVPVVLVPAYFVFRVNATPANAYIVISDSQGSVDGTGTCVKNVAPNARVRYVVSADTYQTVDQEVTVTSSMTIPVNLTQRMVTVNVVCDYPSGALVKIEDELGNKVEMTGEASMNVPAGSYITYTVSKSGYGTKSQRVQINNSKVIPVYLDATTASLTVNGSPHGATVVITGDGRRVENENTATITVPKNTVCTYTVSLAGYTSISDVVTVRENMVVPVNLGQNNVTLTVISYVASANVTLSWAGGTSTLRGQNSVSVPVGSVVTYTVAAEKYQPESQPVTVNGTQDITVYLKPLYDIEVTSQYPVFGDVTIWVNGLADVKNHYNSVRVVKDTDVMWSVDANGFVSQSDRFLASQDLDLKIDLTQEQLKYNFTVNTSNQNTVVINGEAARTISVRPGTRCNYEVSRIGFNTYTGYYDMGAADYTTPLITLDPVVEYCTLNVTTTPASAKCWLNGQETKTIIVEKNSSVHYKVEKVGWVTEEDDVNVTQDPQSLVVNLRESGMDPLLTVVATPSTASVTIINGETRDTKTGSNSMQVPYGTSLSYLVTCLGYLDKGESNIVMTESITRHVDLEQASPTTCVITLVPSSPANATCYINGIQTRQATVPIGSTVQWRATHPDFVEGTGSFTATGDTTVPIQLTRLYTITVTATPRDSYVSLWRNGAIQSIQEGYNTLRAPAGSTIRMDVERDGYNPWSETIVSLSENVTRDIELNPMQVKYRFTVAPTPSDATVYIGGFESSTKYVDVHPGTVVNFAVQKTGYNSVEGQYYMQDFNHTEYVTLTEAVGPSCTLTVVPIPSSAKVYINGILKDVGMRYVEVPQGTTVHITIVKIGFETYDEDYVVTQTETLTIPLNEEIPIT